MPEPHDLKCKYLSNEIIRTKADSFRDRNWPVGKLPVNMESIVEEVLRLHIIPERNLFRSLQIDAFLTNDLKGIVVDYGRYIQDRYANRLRFTFAHEVGHLIIHRYIYEKVSFTTPEEYFEFQSNFPKDDYKDFEYQANEFAGRLLVPRDNLIKELDNQLEKVRNDPRFSRIIRSDPEMILNRLTHMLCKPFGVSEEVIKKRVQREGLRVY